MRYELRKFNLGLLNGYPVLLRLSEKINFRIVQAVNEANYLSLKKYQGKRNFGIKEKISEIEAAVKYRESLTNNAFMVGIEFEHEAVSLDIRADFFIQTDLLEYIKEDENQIRLPLMNDLQLVANIIENNPENDENHVNREMIDRRR